MRVVRATSAAALFLLFGAIVPAFAQRDQQNGRQDKPDKHQGKQEQGARSSAQQQRPQGQPQQQRVQQNQQERVRQTQPQRVQQTQPQRAQQTLRQRPQQQQGQRSQQARQQQPQRTDRQAAAWQQQRGWLQQGGWQGQSSWQQGRARRWESEHRTWQQRGGYGGYYIPEARFGLYFGSQHYFRMLGRPTIYMGYPRFMYGGFSFLLVDPWPEYWAENWYDTDDVYIDYDDGYYLYNRRHPNVRLAITVAL